MSQSRKRICILGSTGSIGKKTLEVIRDYPDEFHVVGLAAQKSADALGLQVAEFHPDAACLSDGMQGGESDGPTRWFSGPGGLLELIEACEPEMVVVAMVGAAGLLPTLKAIESGVTVALANKEVLVAAGQLTMDLARRQGVAILPIDSEHNAIFQCLDGRKDQRLRRIILTASGGPFRGWSRGRLESATIEDALHHPTWTMGRKITVDSATLMNKGFEVIEGHHLFGLAADRFEVVVHPQSVVHSLVEFVDGSILAQMGVTDMYFPIANVLSYPRRLENARFKPLDLTAVGSLGFEKYDPVAFPCPGFAYEAARLGGTFPAVLNAANEIAVERFLADELRFVEIPDVIQSALEAHGAEGRRGSATLEEIHSADAWARNHARTKVGQKYADKR